MQTIYPPTSRAILKLGSTEELERYYSQMVRDANMGLIELAIKVTFAVDPKAPKDREALIRHINEQISLHNIVFELLTGNRDALEYLNSTFHY